MKHNSDGIALLTRFFKHVYRWGSRLWVLVAIGFIVCAIGWFRSWYPGDVHFAVVWTFFAAVGTIAAVWVAVHGATQERHDRREAQADAAEERADRIAAQRRLDAREDEDRGREKRTQALNVSWWTEKVSPGSAEPAFDEYALRGDPPEDIEPVTWFTVALHVLNANDFAVRACSVRISGYYGGGRHIGFLPPGKRVYKETAGDMAGGTAAARLNAHIAAGRPVEFIEFVDNNQRAWRRYPDGRLELTAQLLDPPTP